MRITEEDFHRDASTLSIECIFRQLSDQEAKNFLEWLSFDEQGDYYLRVFLEAEKRPGGIYVETRAGADTEGSTLTKEARHYLCATYLKPLRDAEKELSPGRRSRLAQILASHSEVIGEDPDHHPLVEEVGKTNDFIKHFFSSEEGGANPVYKRLSGTLEQLHRRQASVSPEIDMDTPNLRSILEKLSLRFSGNSLHPGLGSQNLLFIATELLLLRLETAWLKLALIEEIEAHLDPQAQLRVMQFFEHEAESLQMIVTTHSPSLASAHDLASLVLFRNGKAFPMGPEHTLLDADDYAFLRRFLDATKANLFFSTGVLIVEGAAENILLPTLAIAMTGHTLARSGVSIVNVGSTALLRYARIFHRTDGAAMGIPVACITDRDIPPRQAKIDELVTAKRKTEDEIKPTEINDSLSRRTNRLRSTDVRVFSSPCWTLEYDIALSCLANHLHAAVALAKANDGQALPTSADDRAAFIKVAHDEVTHWKETLGVHEVACRIFKPIVSGSVSKAAVAEFLAELIEERCSSEPVSLKEQLVSDVNLAYLREAIFYVTGEQQNVY